MWPILDVGNRCLERLISWKYISLQRELTPKDLNAKQIYLSQILKLETALTPAHLFPTKESLALIFLQIRHKINSTKERKVSKYKQA